MLQLRRLLAPALSRNGLALRQLGTAAAGATPSKPKDDDETFELLPPGCSMMDPTYGQNSLSDPVVFYDANNQADEYRPVSRKPTPAPPSNLADAQAKLRESKGKQQPAAAKGSAAAEEDDVYVYLPPGSSMREPGYHSMSDPQDARKVYYRDPVPTLRK